jgi:hypothetical protein
MRVAQLRFAAFVFALVGVGFATRAAFAQSAPGRVLGAIGRNTWNATSRVHARMQQVGLRRFERRAQRERARLGFAVEPRVYGTRSVRYTTRNGRNVRIETERSFVTVGNGVSEWRRSDVVLGPAEWLGGPRDELGAHTSTRLFVPHNFHGVRLPPARTTVTDRMRGSGRSVVSFHGVTAPDHGTVEIHGAAGNVVERIPFAPAPPRD